MHGLHLPQGLLTGKYFARGGASPMARLNLYRGRYAEAEGRYSFDRHAQRHLYIAHVLLPAAD